MLRLANQLQTVQTMISMDLFLLSESITLLIQGENERFFIGNGSMGHWVDVYMSDATPQPPPPSIAQVAAELPKQGNINIKETRVTSY